MSTFVGAVLAAVVTKLQPGWSKQFMIVLAAGPIAGESLVGVGPLADADEVGGEVAAVAQAAGTTHRKTAREEQPQRARTLLVPEGMTVRVGGVLFMGLVVGLSLALTGACGGETQSGGSGTGGGGTGGGGTGGGGTGGSGTCGPGPGPDCGSCSGGFSSAVCENGTWKCPPLNCPDAGPCGPMPGGWDCLGCDGELSLPTCVGTSWTCPPDECPDAAADASSCGASEVPTVDGCLSCADASKKLSEAIEAARVANAGCAGDADCVMTGSNTACAGSCGEAVSKGGEAAFQAALAKLDADYCTGFVPVCGYATPKCAAPTLVCNAGTCAAKY